MSLYTLKNNFYLKSTLLIIFTTHSFVCADCEESGYQCTKTSTAGINYIQAAEILELDRLLGGAALTSIERAELHSMILTNNGTLNPNSIEQSRINNHRDSAHRRLNPFRHTLVKPPTLPVKVTNKYN